MPWQRTVSRAVVSAQATPDTEFFQVGAYVEHVPTGLFLYGAYGRLEANRLVH